MCSSNPETAQHPSHQLADSLQQNDRCSALQSICSILEQLTITISSGIYRNCSSIQQPQ